MAEPLPQSEHAAGTPQSASLLIVDDEPGVLSALKRVFAPAGYEVSTAASGQEGLTILETRSVDIIISDLRMPEMDGAEFLGRVTERWPDVVQIVLTGRADVTSAVEVINRGRVYRYVLKPWDNAELLLAVRRAAERRRLETERAVMLETIQRQNAELTELNAGLERKVSERVRAIQKMSRMLEKSNRELRKNLVDTVSVLSSIIETRDGSVLGHSRRVADLAHRLAGAMGLDDASAQALLFAGLLYEIGRVALPDALVGRPYEALTHAERAEVSRYPVVGAALLMSLGSMNDTVEIIRAHGEHFDGSGAPEGLAGAQIPLGARILRVASDFELLRSGRLLLDRVNEQDAAGYLTRHSGTLYDPDVVDELLQLLETRPTGTVPEREIEPAQLRAGMRLTRDLLTSQGVLLLPRGRVVDAALVGQIRTLATNTSARFHIYVEAPYKGGAEHAE